MKKMTLSLVAAVVLMAGMASAASDSYFRIVGGQPDTNDVFQIKATAPSRLLSIACDITATGETNSFTITNTSILTERTTSTTSYTNVYTYATAVADKIAGAETPVFYNSDNDAATDDTEWLKAGDILKLTGNDATQTDNTNVVYRVVLEVKRN